MYVCTYVLKISPFYRTSSPFGAAARKRLKLESEESCFRSQLLNELQSCARSLIVETFFAIRYLMRFFLNRLKFDIEILCPEVDTFSKVELFFGQPPR